MTERDSEVAPAAAGAAAAQVPEWWRRRSRLVLGMAAVLLLAVAVALMFGGRWWRRDEAQQSAGSAAAGGASSGADVPYLDGSQIRFSPGFAERAHITWAAAAEREIAPVIAVSGVVAADPRQITAVGSRIAGRVRNIFKFEGDEVQAGEVLAELESAELGRAQAEVLKLRAREEAALADEKREAALAAARVTAERDAQLARATALAIKAERRAAEQAVRALGGEVDAADKEIGILPLRSPIRGKVVNFSITRGQMLEPTHTAFQVADMGKLWITLNVFERDLVGVREGDQVAVSPQMRPDAVIKGRVARVGDVLDGASHTAVVRVEIDNQQAALRLGQAVKARLTPTGFKTRQVSVPVAAVTEVDGKSTLFVSRGELGVEVRTVVLGPSDGEFVAVMEGIQAGESVVASGVFALKSEIFR